MDQPAVQQPSDVQLEYSCFLDLACVSTRCAIPCQSPMVCREGEPADRGQSRRKGHILLKTRNEVIGFLHRLHVHDCWIGSIILVSVCRVCVSIFIFVVRWYGGLSTTQKLVFEIKLRRTRPVVGPRVIFESRNMMAALLTVMLWCGTVATQRASSQDLQLAWPEPA